MALSQGGKSCLPPAVFYAKGVPYISPGLRTRCPGYAVIDNSTPPGVRFASSRPSCIVSVGRARGYAMTAKAAAQCGFQRASSQLPWVIWKQRGSVRAARRTLRVHIKNRSVFDEIVRRWRIYCCRGDMVGLVNQIDKTRETEP
jgi:hypothetical protein